MLESSSLLGGSYNNIVMSNCYFTKIKKNNSSYLLLDSLNSNVKIINTEISYILLVFPIKIN